MSKTIRINNTTLVTGATSLSGDKFLVAKLNHMMVGLPLYTFDWTFPEMDALPYTEIDIKNGTFVDSATSYTIAGGPAVGQTLGVAVATGTMISNTTGAFAFMLYRVDKTIDPSVNAGLEFTSPTLVSNLVRPGEFYVISVNGRRYGTPIYTYSNAYPFTEVTAQSAINVDTVINISPTTNIVTPQKSYHGSTNLNSKVKTYADVIRRIKTQIGHPFIQLEVCEDVQIAEFIDLALEWYTKYAGYTEEYLIFDSRLYREPGLKIDNLFSLTPTMRETFVDGMSGCWDYDLGDYRKVVGVFDFQPGESTGINTLFTLEQAMAQQTYFSYMLGNAGFDLVTWEVLKQWLDLRTKVLAQTYYVDFDENRQLLRLIPPPNRNSGFYGVVGAWVEKPIAYLIREQWVQKYALALTKIAIGNIRGKYQSMQLFGGGVLNYNDLLAQGLKEKEELEKSLQDGDWYDTAPPRFFLGVLAAILVPAGIAASTLLLNIGSFIC